MLEAGLALAVTAALVACGSAEPGTGRPDAVNAAATSSPANIAGHWLVVALDGEALDPRATPITVRIDAESIRAQSQCVPFPWIYKRRGERILLGKINRGAVCARGLSHWEQEFEIGMYNADRVVRTADGGLEFSGSGGTVTMRRR